MTVKIDLVKFTKAGGLEVGYSETVEHGIRAGTISTEDPPHPDLDKAWKAALPHVLSILGVGDKEDLHTFRSVRFKNADYVLEVDFTILRKVPYSTRPLVWNTPPVKAKADGSGIPDRLHQLLNLIGEEAQLFVRKGKTAQTEMALEEENRGPELVHADA
jgi:hypothetical protein